MPFSRINNNQNVSLAWVSSFTWKKKSVKIRRRFFNLHQNPSKKNKSYVCVCVSVGRRSSFIFYFSLALCGYIHIIILLASLSSFAFEPKINSSFLLLLGFFLRFVIAHEFSYMRKTVFHAWFSNEPTKNTLYDSEQATTKQQ